MLVHPVKRYVSLTAFRAGADERPALGAGSCKRMTHTFTLPGSMARMADLSMRAAVACCPNPVAR